MKNGRMTVGLVVMLCLAVPAYSRVTIISEQHHVYGSADTPIWFDSYSITGTEPLDHTVYGEAHLAPWPWDYVVGIYTSTKAGNFSVAAYGAGTDDCWMSFAAASTYGLVFNTTRVQISLSVIDDFYNYNGGVWFSLWGPNVDHFIIASVDKLFVYNSIVPGNIYNLYIYSGGSLIPSWGGGQITVDIIPIIPAPGAFFLVGIGISMIGWLRRRRVV